MNFTQIKKEILNEKQVLSNEDYFSKEKHFLVRGENYANAHLRLSVRSCLKQLDVRSYLIMLAELDTINLQVEKNESKRF